MGNPAALQPSSLYVKILWGILFRSTFRRCVCHLYFYSWIILSRL